MKALILFYLKKEPNNVDEFAKYWNYIKYLASKNILGTAQIPLDLNV